MVQVLVLVLVVVVVVVVVIVALAVFVVVVTSHAPVQLSPRQPRCQQVVPWLFGSAVSQDT